MRTTKDLKQKIINASLELFAAKGYAGTSMNDIISKTGISKGGVYWHFKSKEDLFVQVIEENYDQWISLLDQALKDIPDPIEKLKKYGNLFITTADIPAWRISPEMNWNEFSPESRQIIDDCLARDGKIVFDLFCEAIERNMLKYDDPKELSWIYISYLEGLFTKMVLAYKYNTQPGDVLEKYALFGVSLFFDAI